MDSMIRNFLYRGFSALGKGEVKSLEQATFNPREAQQARLLELIAALQKQLAIPSDQVELGFDAEGHQLLDDFLRDRKALGILGFVQHDENALAVLAPLIDEGADQFTALHIHRRKFRHH